MGHYDLYIASILRPDVKENTYIISIAWETTKFNLLAKFQPSTIGKLSFVKTDFQIYFRNLQFPEPCMCYISVYFFLQTDLLIPWTTLGSSYYIVVSGGTRKIGNPSSSPLLRNEEIPHGWDLFSLVAGRRGVSTRKL